LGIDSFFLDHSANTTVGKSFGTKIAFSMIGDAKSLKLSGDSTETYLEERAALFNDLPLFLDETSTVDDINLRRIIYKISNEKGKGRGKKDGGVRELSQWKTVVLSTGEKSIVDHDGFSGQEVRVIEIHDEMPYIPDEVEKATHTIENNCGHIIGLYMQKVFANKENLRLRLDVHRKSFMDDESRVVNRLASTFAVIAVAGELLEAVFEDIGIETVDSTELVEQMFDETVRSRPVEPYAVKALRVLRDWTESSKSSFVVNDDLESVKGYKKLGWICGSEFIDIITSEAKTAMKQHGYDFSTARDEWIKMGVVEINDGRKDYKVTHIDEDGNKAKLVLRINVTKMNEILGE
jgi:putative DNA primase/helicase